MATPSEEDIKAQEMIRRWRLTTLKSNAEALGRDYCASLINLSEISGHEPMQKIDRQFAASSGNPDNQQSASLSGNPEVQTHHGSGSNDAKGERYLPNGLECPDAPTWPRTLGGRKEPGTKPPKHGAPVCKADAGDVQAVERELYAALVPANPKVGVEIMAKVGNSYKKRFKVSNRVAMFPKLLGKKALG